MNNNILYTDELGKRISDLIVDGLTIRAIGKMDEMPSSGSIYSWSRDPNHPFFEVHQRVVEIKTWAIIDLIQDVAMSVLQGSIDPRRGQVVFSQLSWLAERLNPAAFSRKIIVDQTVKGDTGVMAITPPINDVDEWMKAKGITVYKANPPQGAENGRSS